MPNISLKPDKFYFYFYFLFIMLSLYSVNIISSLKFSDVAMIIFFLTSIIRFRKIYIDKINVNYLIWLILVLAFSFVISKNIYFSYDNFIFAFFRACLGVFSAFFIPLWIKTSSNKYKILIVIKNILLLHVFIQFLFYILFTIGITHIFNIIPHGEQTNRGEWFNIYSYTTYYRFGGIFEEPSWYCWFMVFLLGIIINYEKITNIKILGNTALFFIFLSFILTFSIAGLVSIIILILIRFSSTTLTLRYLLIYIAVIITFLLFLQFNESPFIERIYATLNGNDSSSNIRLFGSIDRLYNIVTNNIFGTGLGNSIQGITYYSGLEKIYYNGTISNQNGYIETFISTGLICGTIYILPIIKLATSKNTICLFITITLVFFTTSSIFNSAMWFLLFLSFYITKDVTKNENTNIGFHNE